MLSNTAEADTSGNQPNHTRSAGKRNHPDSNAAADPKVWRLHWRRQLHRLAALDLPLLAVGAGPERKAPASLRNGELLVGWTTAKHTPSQLEGACSKVIAAGTRTGKDAHGLIAFDIDGETAVSWCLEHGCDPATTPTWQIHRNTDESRLKVAFTLSEEQQQQLGQIKTTQPTKDAVKDDAGNVIEKGEAVELFHGTGQVIVLGQHWPSKGCYLWPEGLGPEALAPIPSCWWEAALAIAGDISPKATTAKAKSTGKGDWRPLSPCPICGRDTTSFCSQHRDGKVIRCFHGNTFSPPSGLRRGDEITDKQGTIWAYSKTEAQKGGEVFSVFVEPDPEKRQRVKSKVVPIRQGIEKGSAAQSEQEPQGEQQKSPPKTEQEPAEVFDLASCRSDWLPLVMQHVFTSNGERWISVENILHQWTGTHYGPVADLELAPKVARFLCRLSYLDDKTGENVHHWARPARVDEAIQWLKKRTVASIEDFNPANSLNLQNGVLSWSWEDGQFVTRLAPHHPAQRFTYCQSYGYDPHASRDTLDRLLQAVEDGEQDTFQRVMGSGLQLARYRAIQGRPRAILAIGDGQNGKDTLQGAMSETLGNRGFTHCSIGDFQQYDRGRKFPLAPLYGSRINWSSENTGYARLESIQSLKTAITGENMSYEVKNVQEISYSPNTLLIFNCNDAPRLDASSAAMESRWHVMAFRKRFTNRPDPNKPNELQADPRLKDDHEFIREAICPAMLNWLLEGLQLAICEGITYNPDSEALEAVRRQSCHLFDFVDDAGLVADPKGQVEASYVFELLWNWYQSQKILHVDPNTDRPSWNIHDLGGDHPVKIPRDLAARLRAVFPDVRSERGTDKSRRSVLHGVRFGAVDTNGGGIAGPGGGTAEARAEA